MQFWWHFGLVGGVGVQRSKVNLYNLKIDCDVIFTSTSFEIYPEVLLEIAFL